MSLPDLPSDRPRGVLVRRPKTTIYTVLLGIAVAALAIGCLLLLFAILRYGAPWASWKIPTNFR
ncbi:MAG: hypothetical protein WD669_13050 [Pirellulales bacterium]